jgi:hypothetical protein
MARMERTEGQWGGGRRLHRLMGIVVLAVILQACSDITSSGRPGNARFRLEGTEDTGMTLMTSQNFYVGQDGGLDFQSLDTVTVTVPYDETVPLGSPARFYISAANAEGEPMVFTMKVWIGGESWYNETRILEPGDDFEFVYRYNEPGIF